MKRAGKRGDGKSIKSQNLNPNIKIVQPTKAKPLLSSCSRDDYGDRESVDTRRSRSLFGKKRAGTS